jgi:metal-responsive CopG/Arc/MetJ family transcriptional regulator
MSQRTTKVIGFSVPPEIYNEIINYAKKEQKTKSELFREMVAIYRSKKEEEEYQRLLKYGQLKALDLDIKSEEDVEKAIDEFRES